MYSISVLKLKSVSVCTCYLDTMFPRLKNKVYIYVLRFITIFKYMILKFSTGLWLSLTYLYSRVSLSKNLIIISFLSLTAKGRFETIIKQRRRDRGGAEGAVPPGARAAQA